MKGENGINLIELLLAVALISGVLIMLSLLFPTTSRNVVVNHQRTAATNLAVAKIENVKKQPYAFLDATPPGTYFLSIADPGCDCSTVSDFSAFPATLTEVVPSSGTTYTRYTCINFVSYVGVGGGTLSHCPGSPSGDTGAKYLRVHVAWPSGSSALFIDQDSISTRY